MELQPLTSYRHYGPLGCSEGPYCPLSPSLAPSSHSQQNSKEAVGQRQAGQAHVHLASSFLIECTVLPLQAVIDGLTAEAEQRGAFGDSTTRHQNLTVASGPLPPEAAWHGVQVRFQGYVCHACWTLNAEASHPKPSPAPAQNDIFVVLNFTSPQAVPGTPAIPAACICAFSRMWQQLNRTAGPGAWSGSVDLASTTCHIQEMQLASLMLL